MGYFRSISNSFLLIPWHVKMWLSEITILTKLSIITSSLGTVLWVDNFGQFCGWKKLDKTGFIILSNFVWFVACLWFQLFIVSITKGFKRFSVQFHVVTCSPVIHWVNVFLKSHIICSWWDVAAKFCVIREIGEESLGHTSAYVAHEYKEKQRAKHRSLGYSSLHLSWFGPRFVNNDCLGTVYQEAVDPPCQVSSYA